MKQIVYITYLWLFSIITWAQPADRSLLEAYPELDHGHLFYDLDFVHCTVGFSIRHMGWSKVSGNFTEFSGAVVYDEQNLESLAVTFSIDVNSINTNQEWRDKDLNSEKWFNSKQYPQIVFQSRSVVVRSGALDLIGNLTMKGVTREVKLSMEHPSGYFKSYVGYELAFNGTTRINRKDFGIGENTWWNDIIEGIAQLDDSVDINLSIIYQLQSPEFIKSRFFDNETAIYETTLNQGIIAGIREFDRQKRAYDALNTKDDESFSAITFKDLNTVGLAFVLEGKDELAKALFEHNIKVYPNNDHAIMSLALFHLKQKHYNKAIELSERSLDLNPNNAWALEVSRQLDPY